MRKMIDCFHYVREGLYRQRKKKDLQIRADRRKLSVSGKGPRSRIVAHLGQIQGNEEQLQKIISGLIRIVGKPAAKNVIFEQPVFVNKGLSWLEETIWDFEKCLKAHCTPA
jgi:hypothetical protein